MNQYKYLIKNVGLLTLSSFATKLLSFFLVPLYTNVLTTTEYGTYDLFNATIGVLIPILTLNIQQSVVRFLLGDNYNKKAVATVATRYLFVANMFVLIGLSVNGLFGISETIKQYALYFFLMFFAQSLSEIVVAYIRGTDQIAALSISSVMASIITLSSNIIFLVVFKWGLCGYFAANILGPLVQCGFLIIKTKLFKEINIRESFLNEKNEMLEYSKPMIANSIAWWVNNTSDRYIVIFFCGLAENGIYSVASKIPSILNVFQTVFNQAWTLSAVRDFDPEDKNGFFTTTYKSYNCMMVVLCSAIILFDKVLANFLYAKDFFVAWKYVPWLTIAIVFGAMSGYLGGFFSAVKDSKIFARSSMVGAITNIVLNLLFTPLIGALGAAIATTLCYFEVWVIRYWHSKKIINMKISLSRDLLSYALLVVQAVILLNVEKGNMLEVTLFFIIILLNLNDIVMILNKIVNRIR